MKNKIILAGYVTTIFHFLSIIWTLGSFYFTWIFKGGILQTPILRTGLLILFPINVAYLLYWHFKIDNIQRKKYPALHKKFEYKGSYRLQALTAWYEIYKNSHPEDKLYSRCILHQRISGLVLLFNLLALFFV